MAPASDAPAHRSQNPEDQAEDDQDDADHPEEAEVEDGAEDQADDSENDQDNSSDCGQESCTRCPRSENRRVCLESESVAGHRNTPEFAEQRAAMVERQLRRRG